MATQIFNKPQGFMLPSVIIISTAMLFIAVALSQMVVVNYRAITRGMYSQIAQTAAKSGIDYAKEQFVATGAYNGTTETSIIQNGKYRVTFTVTVHSTSADGLRKDVEAIGRVYLPELSSTQLLVRSVRSDIIRTSATAVTPDVLSPMAWYDASENSTVHGPDPGAINWTHLNTSHDAYLNERTSDGTNTNGSWNANWMGLGYNSQLSGTVYGGTLFDLSGVPDGATIESAYLQITSQGTTSGTATIAIQALADGQAPASNVFSSPPASNQLRNKTTVGPTVSWTAGDWPVGSQTHQSPDIKSIIQAVIDQPSFDQASEFVALRTNRTSGSATHRITKGASSLIVNYTISGAPAVSNGEVVVTWDDRSGNGRHLLATTSREPTYLTNQQNGLAMLDFPYAGGSSGKYMTSSSFDLLTQAQAGTMFVVAKPATGAGQNASLVNISGTIPSEANCVSGQPCTQRVYEIGRSGSTNDAAFSVIRSGSGGSSTLEAAASSIFNDQAAMLTGGVAYAIGSCNPSMNGASVDMAHDRFTTINCPATSSYPKSFKDGLVISTGNGLGDRNFQGQIGEIILFSKQLSCQQVQSIQKYLRQKWFNDSSDTNIIACPAPEIPGF